MRRVTKYFWRTFGFKKLSKMSGVSRDAPVGIQFLQRATGWLCPRWQFNRLRFYQTCVLLLTFFTYMTYHLTRKPISVVKSVLHRNCSELPPPPGVAPDDDQWCNWAPFNTTDANTLLGTLDSAFLFSYAIAMFVSGMVAERVDLRYFLTLGMLFSAVFCYLFGIARTYNIHNISYYLLVQAAAGIAQTTGWPGTVAIVGKWFGNSKKGLIFGVWNSHTSIGNILGTIMAATFVESDWALSFIYPALVMGLMGLLVFLLLPPHPKCVGIVPTTGGEPRSSRSDDEEEQPQVIVGDQAANLRPSRHSANTPQYSPEPEAATESTALLSRRSSAAAAAAAGGGGAVSFTRALAIPGVVEFSLSLFFAKLVSYTFLYWLPVYINSSTGGVRAVGRGAVRGQRGAAAAQRRTRQRALRTHHHRRQRRARHAQQPGGQLAGARHRHRHHRRHRQRRRGDRADAGGRGVGERVVVARVRDAHRLRPARAAAAAQGSEIRSGEIKARKEIDLAQNRTDRVMVG
ncbi:glucose-6-phosphate exchanger SLC37A2 isoform X2 [Galleria mellonella]|uniref:Glucose-6-phosphate exchanger SLC37A2 isoform X2 n=1 Tax=Galleria mellonella TaxID=7137 RepID=A0A6J1WQI7_GALME|nr:glucose-6-phosphate exchanger SLC37A2 isoform X2 [Galleria mellonella]XP_052748749.1 glucose-6-phosphate exchanger SLC37A2 isoform X2 [Galleria mellonella]